MAPLVARPLTFLVAFGYNSVMYAKATLVGRLTRDPETRETKNGGTMTTAQLAYRTHTLGREQDNFIDLIMFGKLAITFANYAKRGRMILAEGQLRLERTRDEETNQIRERVRLFVNGFQFLDRPNNDDDHNPNLDQEKPIKVKRVVDSPATRYFDEDDDAFDPFLD